MHCERICAPICYEDRNAKAKKKKEKTNEKTYKNLLVNILLKLVSHVRNVHSYSNIIQYVIFSLSLFLFPWKCVFVCNTSPSTLHGKHKSEPIHKKYIRAKDRQRARCYVLLPLVHLCLCVNIMCIRLSVYAALCVLKIVLSSGIRWVNEPVSILSLLR